MIDEPQRFTAILEAPRLTASLFQSEQFQALFGEGVAIPGPPGPMGPEGPPGEPTNILIPVPTEGDLPPAGERGDAVLTQDSGDLWSWNTPADTGALPRPGTHANDYQWINVGHVVGPVGPQGVQGTQGIQGIPGTPGSQGPPGAQGTTGAQGPPGATGATGTQGATGPQGIPGSPGPSGPQGPKGDPGTGISIKGTVATAADLPMTGNADGDAWVAADTGHMWVWDAAHGVWIDAGKVQGPPGPEGPSGPQGTTGPQGPPGATGATGSQGPAGAQGPQGNPGATGSQGPPGTTGAQGAQGIQGPQGVKGDTGDTGPQGAAGATGSQGPKGDPGSTGATGAQGPKGDPGTAGATGATGPQGPPTIIQDEGTPLTARATLNFVGAGVTATDNGTANVVTIPGASQTPWLSDIDANKKVLNNLQIANLIDPTAGNESATGSLYLSTAFGGLMVTSNRGAVIDVAQDFVVRAANTERMRAYASGGGSVRFAGYVESAPTRGFTGNLAYDGTPNWRYIANGSGYVLQARTDGASVLYTAPNGTAGAVAVVTARLTFRDDGITVSSGPFQAFESFSTLAVLGAPGVAHPVMNFKVSNVVRWQQGVNADTADFSFNRQDASGNFLGTALSLSSGGAIQMYLGGSLKTLSVDGSGFVKAA